MKERIISSFQEFFLQIVDRTPQILVAVILLLIFIFLGVFLRNLVKRRLFANIQDRLVINFVSRLVFLVMLILGIILFLRNLGWEQIAGGLLAGAGVSAIVIGFAFKDIGENFLAGFFLAFSRPFGIGDIIQVEDLKGTVKALNFRNTYIRTFDGKDIFLPNALLIKSPLINYTRDGLLRYDFLIGLDYGDNIVAAISGILATIKTNAKISNGGELDPFVTIEEFSTSTINLRVYYWINHDEVKDFIPNLKTALMNDIVNNLSQKGFNMPADILELKIYQEGKPIPISIKNEDK
jgi:small conductance mechanosensitive channel